MSGPMVLMVISLAACLGVCLSPRYSIREAIWATVALASLIAIPIGYALGTFT